MCNRFQQNVFTKKSSFDNAQEMEDFFSLCKNTEEKDVDIFPDHDATLICMSENERLFKKNARWGLPTLRSKNKPITNIRNLNSWWWNEKNKEYILERKYRCVIPFSKFAEPPRKPIWFCTKNKPMSFFAGFWCPWIGERLESITGKSKRIRKQGMWELFAFLTTSSNEITKAYNPKSMPVILSRKEEVIDWLLGGKKSLKKAQKPIDKLFLTCLNPN
jgi:putative SOS response-associated peptidase YedK